jgi:GDP-L-fucose synthase
MPTKPESITLITGSGGMVGGSIARKAKQLGLNFLTPQSMELDLRDREKTLNYLRMNNVTQIIHCAASVSGISANIEAPPDFILKNLLIDSSLLSAARTQKIEKLIYMGSSCMYPKDFRQPLVELDILAGRLEPTNEGYALSKISGAKAVENVALQDGLAWRILIPSNLYGPGDNFGPNASHLIASIIRKIYLASIEKKSSVEIWGDGKARREFTYVEDLANFIVMHIKHLNEWPIYMNIGLGIDYSVTDFYQAVAELLNYDVKFVYNTSKPVGMMQKLMNSDIAKKYGWKPSTELNEGLKLTLNWFIENGAR